VQGHDHRQHAEKKLMKFSHCVFELCEQTNTVHRQTNTTDILITALCTPLGGRVTKLAKAIKYRLIKQEASEKCWAHSPLRAAARPNFTLLFTRCRYCRTPPLSHAACASMSTTTTTKTTKTTTRDRGDRYGPIEWAQ